MGYLPGSFFKRRTALAATGFSSKGEDTLENVLKRVTKDNLYKELNAASLSSEEKLAIASVKEASSRDIVKTLDRLRGKGEAMSGDVCGQGYGGSCGDVCGNSCSLPVDVLSVVGRGGKLSFKIQSLNKTTFLDALERAWKITK